MPPLSSKPGADAAPASVEAQIADGPPRVTIAQIAKECGLSIATVSKVLNGKPHVSAANRQRVQRLIVSHGYQRRSSPLATAPPLIDVVSDQFDGSWAFEITRGAMEAAQANGLNLALTSLEDDDERRVWFDRIIDRGTRGLILLLARLTERQRDELTARRLPFVVFDHEARQAPEVSSVGSTNWSGGLVATNHLIELGHRRIAVITGPAHSLASRARVDGYRSALEASGLKSVPELCREGDFRVEGGFAEAKALLSLPEPPTAIFACNDLQALGVIEAARKCGLVVPDQLSVVGFDDLPMSQWASPPLTTVRQPLNEMGALAVKMLLEPWEGPRQAHRRVELATDLVVRESTAPPITYSRAATS